MEPPSTRQPSDFSIEHILHKAGPPPPDRFEWLRCTRYKPPKLHRCKRKDGAQKRKLGRNPRIPFSAAQVAALEERFKQNPYLSSQDVAHLSSLLRLTDTRVKIWFQNRRARERREKDAKSKPGHTTVTEKNVPSREEGSLLTSSGQTWSAFLPCKPSHCTPS